MPRGPMKALLSYCIPEVYYRPFYSLASALLIQLLIFCWHPMPTVIWDFQHPILWYLIMGKKYTNLCNSYIYLAAPRNKTWRHLKEINVCNCPRISCYASSHILAEKTGRWIQSERSCMHVIWTPIASTEFSKFWSVVQVWIPCAGLVWWCLCLPSTPWSWLGFKNLWPDYLDGE